MRKVFTWLLVVVLIISATTGALAASSYNVRIDKTVYSPGTYMTVEVEAPSREMFSVEILKGSNTLMSLPLTFPADGNSIVFEILIPATWTNGPDYVLRAGRGSDVASVGFEISSNAVNFVYALSIDKATVRTGDTLVLSGTSSIANAAVQYFISSSSVGFAAKTGDVIIANNRFECFVAIDSTYAVGMYTVKIGSNNVFSNECTFYVTSAPKVAAIAASPASSTITAGTKVSLSTATPNAAIYYTLNGDTPTKSSTLYRSTGITINATTTLKAIAVRDGYADSDVFTQTYIVDGGGVVVGGGGGSGGGGGGDGDGGGTPPETEDTTETGGSNSINPPTKPPFADVKGADWFMEDVIYVYDNGLMNGTSATTFSPQANLTRGMIVMILYRLAGEPSVSNANPFDDVAAGIYYYNAVIWAEANGIVTGYGDGKFGPNDNITREQLATILMRYMNFNMIVLPVNLQYIFFADEADISGYAMDAIQTLNKLGIINGAGKNADGQTIINPKAGATRAETAAMLHRFLDLIEG